MNRHVLIGGFLTLSTFVILGYLLWKPKPPIQPPPLPFVSCGERRFLLAISEDNKPELRELEGQHEGRRFTIGSSQGNLVALNPDSPEKLSVRLNEHEGVLLLQCNNSSLQLQLNGVDLGSLQLSAIHPSLRFVPGGAPQGGEMEASFAVLAWGEQGLGLGAGRFLWRDEPLRFEVAPSGTLTLIPGSPSTLIAGSLERQKVSTQRYMGHMEPPSHAHGLAVLGLDHEGKMAGGGTVRAGGFFEIGGAATMVTAYASAGGTRVGPAVGVKEGMEIPEPRIGVLRVHVVDHDRGVDLPARVVVHGHQKEGFSGTKEPNLGPPYRSSGAGPLLDTEDGHVRLTLPSGIYRVLATRGIEYTVDEEEVEVVAGAEREVKMRLRRVIETPGWAGCDLHVHARGSFDTLVSIDDRVRSLMAAGLDFAAASEHNRTGSYDLSTLAGQDTWLTWIPAVEVTTMDPSQGHFNVMPYNRPEAPRYRRTSLRELISYVMRKSPDSLVQVNHPRMGTIGHFNALRMDPKTQKGIGRLARDFVLLEIYNGFDLATPAKTEATLREWLALLERGHVHWGTGSSDSHNVQYTGVGYPRTYVAVKEDHEGGEGAALDISGLFDGLRKGKILVTSGPFVDVSQEGRGPGEEMETTEGKARFHVRVRATPWIDTSELEIYVGGKSVLRRNLSGRPERRMGKPEGGLQEERQRMVRFEEDLEVNAPPGAQYLVVVVRGQKKVSEVLPFMEWTPMAIVNPMRLRAR